MKALILAGGKGTRLRPLTVYTPKPVVPLVNRPFLLYQIEILRRAGIVDITLSLNYQPDKIERIIGHGKEWGVNINYITEPQPMGTAGAYKYAAQNIDETTIVLNGDILTDLIISKVIKQHQETDAEATICLTPVENPSAYGLVETDAENKILRFLEKPKPEELEKLQINTVNAGIYILEPTILDLIPKGENHSFEYNVFPEILAQQKEFRAYIMDNDYWCDIGTPEKYLKAHNDFLNGNIKRFDLDNESDFERATSTYIDDKSIIGKDCVIKPSVKIINSVIGQGVSIEERVTIENSVIWPHSRISNSAEIRDSILARSCYVGKNVIVSKGSVLGDKTSLTDYTKV
jgi:NDP-sugar pyrophosphorylase family protein